MQELRTVQHFRKNGSRPLSKQVLLLGRGYNVRRQIDGRESNPPSNISLTSSSCDTPDPTATAPSALFSLNAQNTSSPSTPADTMVLFTASTATPDTAPAWPRHDPAFAPDLTFAAAASVAAARVRARTSVFFVFRILVACCLSRLFELSSTAYSPKSTKNAAYWDGQTFACGVAWRYKSVFSSTKYGATYAVHKEYITVSCENTQQYSGVAKVTAKLKNGVRQTGRAQPAPLPKH